MSTLKFNDATADYCLYTPEQIKYGAEKKLIQEMAKEANKAAKPEAPFIIIFIVAMIFSEPTVLSFGSILVAVYLTLTVIGALPTIMPLFKLKHGDKSLDLRDTTSLYWECYYIRKTVATKLMIAAQIIAFIVAIFFSSYANIAVIIILPQIFSYILTWRLKSFAKKGQVIAEEQYAIELDIQAEIQQCRKI